MTFTIKNPNPKRNPIVFAFNEDRTLMTWDDYHELLEELSDEKVHSQSWYVDTIVALIYAYHLDDTSPIWKDTEVCHELWDKILLHLACSDEHIEKDQLLTMRQVLGGFWYA